MPKRKNSTKTISKRYLDELSLKDLLGELTEDEIKIAKTHGVYRFDGYVKKQRTRKYNAAGRRDRRAGANQIGRDRPIDENYQESKKHEN